MIALITGARGGIGSEVTTSLLAAGHEVIALGRAEGDLSSLVSVAALADQLRSRPVDLLINNAGIAGKRGITSDGFELAFGVNYLSHYLLTRALAAPRTRVVNVSSDAHRSAPSLDPSNGLGRTKSLTGWREYAFSKACQIAFTIELASRGVDAYSVHPGVIATGLWRRVPQPLRWVMTKGMAPPSLGALPVLKAAMDQDLPPGSYVTPSGVVEPSAVTRDRAAIARLWDQSEKWVADHLK
ncbi:MAG: SDR family NAD(P)-dependent oxidoreductase [Acidimicrobiia bacterium]